ncbi:hypothetical protein LTR86_003106 [Recurvomyces mirabilis]|nr:hypothetical protein LTR86_003106 [Recurvomyces mirabilis]
MSDRERSASPAREESKPKKQKMSGFKWKDKSSRNEDGAQDPRDSGRLERGYRNRSPRRDSYRDKANDREREDGGRRRSERDAGRDEEEERRPREGSPTRGGRGGSSWRPDRSTDERRHDTKSEDRADKTDHNATAKNDTATAPPKKPKEKKPKVPTPAAPTGPMIIVNINDRLGTKASIPCLASDSIKAFKAIVAAHIGRQPHEIMLKRQGERPFKDVLTLEDYGVSNGVQLDLEIDTGD